MYHSLLFFILLILQFPAVAQSDTAVANEAVLVDNEIVFTIAEQMPEFPGGEQAMMKHIWSNLEYPKILSERDVPDTIYMRFIVRRDGSITNIEVIRGLHEALEAQAIRVIKTMPKWTPGKQNGKEVSVQYVVPLRIELE